MFDSPHAPVPPPRLKDPQASTDPPSPWAGLPTGSRRQVQQLLGRLLVRLLEARRLKEVSRD